MDHHRRFWIKETLIPKLAVNSFSTLLPYICSLKTQKDTLAHLEMELSVLRLKIEVFRRSCNLKLAIKFDDLDSTYSMAIFW